TAIKMDNSKRIFHFNNPNDVADMMKMLEDKSDAENIFKDSDESDDSVTEDNMESSESEQNDEEFSDDDSTDNASYFLGIDKFSKWYRDIPNKKNRATSHNLLKQLPGVIGPAKLSKSPVDCWKYLFTGDILDIIVKYTNQYINIIKNKYGWERDAKLTDGIEIKAFLGILYLDGAYRALDLVEELKEMKLSYVCTVKKNKRELPPEFVTTKSREVYSSSFGFNRSTTLVSYVPKKNKTVILVTSFHHNKSLDSETGEKKKPSIFTFYNFTKGGVDNVDKMCAIFSIARNIKCWPMNIFFTMFNVAGINLQIIYLGNDLKPIKRRLFLKQLSHELTLDELQRRSEKTIGIPLHIQTKLK
ncbi:Hypothetical predicted protein, partial [Pelobates cultripes]